MRRPDPLILRRRPDQDGRDWSEILHARQVRREIYGSTKPREGLCAFDAAGMDILEGRA